VKVLGRRVPMPEFAEIDVLAMGVVLGLVSIGYGLTIGQRISGSVPFFDVIGHHWWSWMFMASGALLLLGLAARGHFVVWLGAGLIVVVWTTYTIGICLDQPDRAVFYLSRNALPILVAGLGWMRLGPFEEQHKDG
jgi:hypothetical protein